MSQQPIDLQKLIEEEIARRIASGQLLAAEDPETERLAREYRVEPVRKPGQGRAA
jgi:hypothetical protein